jgi:hypothetical protein
MEEVRVKTWEECEKKLSSISSSANKHALSLLFRGHGNAGWMLQTTLERTLPQQRFFVIEYYRLMLRTRPQIEAFTERQWDLPEYENIEKLTRDYNDFSMALTFGKLQFTRYMIYLRHHGFPSPLLDWSRSPYIAAYFAFRNPSGAEVAIYVFSERTVKGVKERSSNEGAIYSVGSYSRGHKRHFLQQADYTMCVRFHDYWGGGSREWQFVDHEGVFARGRTDQDVLWKIIIPATERLKVLRHLDTYNLNALSLFGSEESLMETMAFRELEVRTATPLPVMAGRQPAPAARKRRSPRVTTK